MLLPEVVLRSAGIVVRWFVCLFVRPVYSPGCHSTAFTVWIASRQKVSSFKIGIFDVKASLSNKSEQKLNLHCTLAAN